MNNYNEIQLTDTTDIRSRNTSHTVLPNWKIICNDANNNGSVNRFKKTTRSNSPTGHSGATSLPPIGKAFMYVEKSGNKRGNGVIGSFERTDIIQITIISFYYNRYSILTSVSHKSLGRFQIQLLLEDNTWSAQYTIPKNYRYSDTSTDWTFLNLDFTVENYGNKLVNDQIDTAHAHMCFSDITITHSVY